MAIDPALVDASDRSLVDSFRKLAASCGDVLDAGGVFAFSTGLTVSLFNGCIALNPVSATDLHGALEWLATRDVPFSAWIDEKRAAGAVGVLTEFGLEPDPDPDPGMALHPIPTVPQPAPGVRIARVDERSLAEHVAMRVADGMPPEVVAALFSSAFLADPDVEMFTAFLAGEPVGGSVAIRSGDVTGVYAVGTLEAARRQGVGTAATWACVAAADDWGCHTVVLQSSEMGFGVYRAMGFETVAEYARYRQPRP